MTPEQIARLPELAQDIVSLDRRIADLRGLTDWESVMLWRDLKRERDRLVSAMDEIYGRAPIKGENGPGSPVAMAA